MPPRADLRLLALVTLAAIMGALTACNPNDCGFPIGKKCEDDPRCCFGKAPPNTPGGNYYVSAHYYCKDVKDHVDRGECDLTTYSTVSCQDALDSHERLVTARGDVCKHCDMNVTDLSKYVASYEFVHLGPCQAYGQPRRASMGHLPESEWALARSDAWGAALKLPGILPMTGFAFRIVEQAAAAQLPESLGVAVVKGLPCTLACRQFDSSCLRPLVAVGGAKPPLAAFAARVTQTQTGVIAKAEVMKLFQVARDPCNRADWESQGGEFINRGDGACEMHLTLTIGGQKETARIELPEVVHGNTIVTKTGFILRFTSPQVSPGVYTDDRNFSEAWGGVVTELESDGSYIYVRTSAGCIALRL